MQIQLTGDGIFQKIQVGSRAHNGTGKTPIPVNWLGNQFSGSRVRSCWNYPHILEFLGFSGSCFIQRRRRGRDWAAFLKAVPNKWVMLNAVINRGWFDLIWLPWYPREMKIKSAGNVSIFHRNQNRVIVSVTIIEFAINISSGKALLYSDHCSKWH